MPNYFSLTRKTDREAGPVPFNTIDEEICAAMGETPHDVHYLDGWYDSIGYRLSLGKSWDEIRKSFALQAMEADERDDGAPYADLMQRLIKITDWLEERFEVNCGYTRRNAPSDIYDFQLRNGPSSEIGERMTEGRV